MVSFVERIRASITAFRNASNGRKDFPLPVNVYMGQQGQLQWSLIDYKTYVREGFSKNAVVYSSFRFKMDSVSQSPLRAYQGHPDNAELIDNPKHPLAKLALRPNSFMSRVEFMQYCVAYLNLHGNCFIYLTGINDNLPLAMYPLRPDRVQIVPEKTDTGHHVIGYLYFPEGATIDNAVPIMPDNMAHIKFVNPYDNLEGQGYGLTPMSAAAYQIDTDNEMTNFIVRFFSNNGMMPGGVISLPYEADPADVARLREQMVDMYGGSSEWGKPLVVDSGGQFSHIVPSFSDMVLEDLDLRNTRRTSAVFGVDAMLIGIDKSASTFSNREEATKDFWQRVMSTELMLFEEELRHKVDLGDGSFLRFDLSGLAAFAVDTAAQVDTYVNLVNHFVPPNTAKLIAGIDMPDIEDGDVSFMPVGLVPMKHITEPPPMPEFPQLNGVVPEENIPQLPETIPEKQNRFRNAVKKNEWGLETKDRFAQSQVDISEQHITTFEAITLDQFNIDKKRILDIHAEHKRKNHKLRKSFDSDAFLRDVDLYLRTIALKRWRKVFVKPMIDVVIDARQRWYGDLELRSFAPDMDYKQDDFPVRSSIEGEYWFSNYTLEFSRNINNATHEGIHAVVRDGLAAGHGTDKIGNNIGLLFQQYMEGNTSPEDWEFMQERMPPYRLEMIARTETHGAMSAGNHAFFEESDVTHKEWYATADNRTRDSHLQAWQRYSKGGNPGPIPLDDEFVVAGHACRYPGDRRLPLGEFINCRCVELPVFED